MRSFGIKLLFTMLYSGAGALNIYAQEKTNTSNQSGKALRWNSICRLVVTCRNKCTELSDRYCVTFVTSIKKFWSPVHRFSITSAWNCCPKYFLGGNAGRGLEKKNEATWRCCEPTCLSLGSLFDLDQCDLWPWYLWTLTYRLHMKCTMQRPWNQVLFTHVTLTFDLRPWPLTSNQVTFDLDPCDLEATCQIHCVTSLKITFFDTVTLSFDLWPWPSYTN